MAYPEYLYHFGILGQKWGVRRYQNEDGSLTPEGKKRYGTQIEREAAKDAQRVSDARVAYGSGSLIRKKLINREIEDKKKNSEYRKAYDEAKNYVDVNKSYRRAEELKKQEGRFNRGWDLYERGKTSVNILSGTFGKIAVSAVGAGGAYAYLKSQGQETVANVMALFGGVSAAVAAGKAVKDVHALNYYKRNRKF